MGNTISLYLHKTPLILTTYHYIKKKYANLFFTGHFDSHNSVWRKNLSQHNSIVLFYPLMLTAPDLALRAEGQVLQNACGYEHLPLVTSFQGLPTSRLGQIECSNAINQNFYSIDVDTRDNANVGS